LHQGLETVFVLQASQSDERGTYEKGCCVLNPTGYEHSVASENGCVVLIQWAKPVKFV
jgi:anti-sigma factor ChrR (cupin superfamily)